MRVISIWSIRTFPLVGLSSPAMMPSSVLLPEPEGPTMATNSPLEISKLMPLRMSMCSWLSGKLFRTSSAVSAACCDAARESKSVVMESFPFLSAIAVPYRMSLEEGYHEQNRCSSIAQRKGNWSRRDFHLTQDGLALLLSIEGDRLGLRRLGSHSV